MTMVASQQISFREWKYLDAHLVWIYEGVPRASGINRGKSEYVTAWYLLEGSVTVDLDGSKISAEKGDWLFLPPSESGRCFSGDVRLLSLHFSASWVTGRQLLGFDGPLVLGSSLTGGWLDLCIPMLGLVSRFYPDAYNELPAANATFDQYVQLQGDFQRWLRQVLIVLQNCGVDVFLPQSRDDRVGGMMYWIDALSFQKPFRMKEMAEAFSLSSTQVNRLFCADFGITPRRYFERRRLEFARVALMSSSQLVKEISYQAGFRHQSEFTGWFKKYTGVSPSVFRLMNADSPAGE